jgi:citronellol/citronellal dehydrogenase
MQIQNAVEKAVERFGGIDILINNASAISLTPIEQTEPKRFDLMHDINVRGTFFVSKACIPYLKNGNNPHFSICLLHLILTQNGSAHMQLIL